MQIHADRSKAAFVRSHTLDWVPSPLAGVDRRMLERDGDEVARATTIVRYAPESYFSAHTHTGGEEFLVLDGVFSDEHGDFPAGTYVRNPVGSSHTPHSEKGTTILVKLWQMPKEDQAFVRINTFDDNIYQAHSEGVGILPLHATDHETVQMVRLSGGTALPEAVYGGGVELYVVEGDILAGEERAEQGDWLRLPVGSRITISSDKGARVYLKYGHLARGLPLPGSG